MCDRCKELEETIIQLKREMGLFRRFPKEWSLSPGESKVLGVLTTQGHMSYDAARLTLWRTPPDNDMVIIRRYVYEIRKKVPWIKIGSIRAVGYTMDADMRTRINDEMVS